MDANPISFPKHVDENGVLCVYEAGRHVPFDIRRVFTVSARAGDVRGDHAHRKCSQLLVCLSGEIRVVCDDGRKVSHHLLDSVEHGLLVPPGIWAREDYMSDGAVMMVLCDRAYEEEDYIRDYDEFKAITGS
ncbi:FdtA/QdtA family cupin domain-containing protein [Sulfuritalea sp.]|uniref:sugar 3,4-ketoisomerase n=1 Tax=Sulfuritalea sp. TaxID=2480090 RepID=UPI001AD08458|nr:FdtA/QdtA family cupin domain-containing protein [Sulfuritalea sp.]MBN8473928.1 FdtA/QdtA family cupin domain-containing protein [Sulfuritalea sp.]